MLSKNNKLKSKNVGTERYLIKVSKNKLFHFKINYLLNIIHGLKLRVGLVGIDNKSWKNILLIQLFGFFFLSFLELSDNSCSAKRRYIDYHENYENSYSTHHNKAIH